jgi:hypothetical protein
MTVFLIVLGSNYSIFASNFYINVLLHKFDSLNTYPTPLKEWIIRIMVLLPLSTIFQLYCDGQFY